MRRNTRRARASRAPRENNSFWLSFSDMMSALLLVFVLVMFYSMYQYFDMLEIKTAELMRQTGLLDEKEAQLDEKDAELAASSAKLSESESALVQQQAKLLLFQKEIELSEDLLASQREELDAARAQLDEQTAQMDEQQGLLDAQQLTMEEQQRLLSVAQAQLGEQQAQMSEQQDKLDALVGVRARIIASLAQALADANIRATVDAQTGSITLDASVLFDLGKSDLKDSGKRVLDQFLPVYLSVLLSQENARNISEVIIEGHTDTTGTYMDNLELSQRRALAVMQYILADDYTKISDSLKETLRSIATANGRSKSNPILNADGTVDMEASRRVEFKFRMQDEQMIDSMRQILENMG